MKKCTFYSAFIIALCFVLVTSCSKSEPEELSSYNILESFSLLKSTNSNVLKSDTRACIIDNSIYLTIPVGSKSSSFIPTFSNGKGSTLIINGKQLHSGMDDVVLSDNSTVVSLAQNGNKRQYTLLLREGDSYIDEQVYNLMKRFQIPGVSLCISKNEKIDYSAGYGFADVAQKVRTLPSHLFRLASMSKCQTSMCIMKLVEQGKLKLTDRVFGKGAILETEFPGTHVSGADDVTVQNLLEHNSGWVSSPDPMFTSDVHYVGKSLDERISYVINNVGLTYTPGAKYSYYNLGFGILGKVIEKLSGMPYEQYLKTYIHAPLGITNIHVGGDFSQRRNDEVVYYSQNNTDGYGNDMEMIAAAGGLIASAEDLMKLMAGVDYGTVVPDILKKETLDLMYTPSACYNRYAKGWRVNYPSNNAWASYHSGNLAGTGVLWVRGNNGTSAVILCNSRSYLEGFDDALYIILGTIIK